MAGMKVLLLAAVSLFLSVSLSRADRCGSPDVTSSVYTSSEEQMSSETVVIVELSLTCKNGVKGVNLYAEFNGRMVPVSRDIDSDKYQVSFSDEHKKIPAGNYKVRFFDDDGYAEVRKAQRSKEEGGAASVKSLFDVDFRHQGVSHGTWIQTEYIATGLIALVFYYAYTTRSRLQS